MKKEKLSDYLNIVYWKDYNKFRTAIIKRCQWTKNQWAMRLNGRTTLTHLEQEVCNEVLCFLYPNLKNYYYGDNNSNSNAKNESGASK